MSSAMISNTQPVRRNMSYRKPAPIYVPTPPSSPPIKPVSPPQRYSMAFETVTHDELPPLPNDWRDAIGRATSPRRERQTSAGNPNDIYATGRSQTPSTGYAPPRTRAFSDPCSMSMVVVSDVDSMSDYSDEEMITPPTSPLMFGSSPRSARKRALPVDYRPPTPPLPAHTKRERHISELSAGYMTPPSIYHAIFPDPPTEQNGNRPDMLAAPSFQTETTQSSSASGMTSFDGQSRSDARDSWATDTWYILPSAADHTAGHHIGEKGGKHPQRNSNNRPLWSRLSDLLKTRFRGMKSVTFDCGSPY